jgi:hypothetical protein
MFKMSSHDSFEYLKHKLWPKQRSGVNLSIWLLTLEVRNRPNFLAYRRRATYHWKVLNKGYNFGLDLTSIESLHTKLWTSKCAKISIYGISGLSFGNPGTKWHLGAGPMAKHRKYYKREGGGFPQVQIVVNFMSMCFLVARPCTKNVPIMH